MSRPYLICERVADKPQPTEACMTVYCAHCHEPVWGVMRHAQASTGSVVVICTQCARQLN